MTWTYADLKAAIVALDPAPANLQAAADALNAQTVQITDQPFPWEAAKALARGSPTQDWARIIARSRQAVTLPAPGQPLDDATQAVLLAINATESQPGDMIDPGNARGWAEFTTGLQALQQLGDLDASTVAAIEALSTVTAPRWQPPVTTGDVQTAQAQP